MAKTTTVGSFEITKLDVGMMLKVSVADPAAMSRTHEVKVLAVY